MMTELNQINKANKAAVGTFFSVRNPKDAMRSFGTFISKIDWSKSGQKRGLIQVVLSDCRQKLFQTRNSSLEQLFIYFVSNF